MQQEIVFSGLQPTGQLHIGNYFGAIKQWIGLQDTHQSLFCIVDLHALTIEHSPGNFPQQTLDVAIDFLALGLDPNKATLFVQSHIPEHAELAWIFQTMTPVSELERMTQFKEKSVEHRKNINTGLLTYPVLMAADILLYKGTLVPVGEDQVQHVELARVIARKFNKRYGDVFPEPQSRLNEAKRLMSLVDPTKKMSKSHGERSYIALTDSPETMKKKIGKAVTATAGGKKNPGAFSLLSMLREVATPEVVKRFEEQEKKGTIKYAELKTQLAHDLADHLSQYRKRREELSHNAERVHEILDQGRLQASLVARSTMAEVRQHVGLLV